LSYGASRMLQYFVEPTCYLSGAILRLAASLHIPKEVTIV
jgi:hypothetical protein